jgi:hypothetical protein
MHWEPYNNFYDQNKNKKRERERRLTLQLFTDTEIPAELVAHQRVRKIRTEERIWKAVKVVSEHLHEEAEKTDKEGQKGKEKETRVAIKRGIRK